MTDAQRLQPPSTVRLTRDQREAVKRLARREKRSVGYVIRTLVDEALASRSVSPKAQAQVAA